MPVQARPFNLVSDIRSRAERLRQAEYKTAIRGSIQARSITADKIAVGTITGTEIQDGGIGGVDIAANTITANNIQAGTITSTEIAAASITATDLSVSSLSAISANLGTITAGTITSATVQSAASGRRVVLDSTGLRGIGDQARLDWYEASNATRTGAARCNLPVTAGSQGIQVELDAYNSSFANGSNVVSSAIRTRDASTDSELSYIRAFAGNVLDSSATIQNNSDERVKEQIEHLPSGALDRICRLRPRSYRRKLGGHIEHGFVAQEVESVIPDIVTELPHSELGTAKAMAYDGITAHLVLAVQELAAKLA